MELIVDGAAVDLPEHLAGGTLLDALRDGAGIASAKDGCSPQGQCGCCTVLVDGAPRVACVTPLRRVAGRAVTTVAGLPAGRRDALVTALVATGGSQCGFCTPGIVCRLAALGDAPDVASVEAALLAHLCRCTGWRSIVDAATAAPAGTAASAAAASPDDRDLARAAARAALEGGTAQAVGPEVVLGRGGFSVDTAPAGALVAVPAAAGGWAVGATLAEARATAGKVQGRRSGAAVVPPLEVPAGRWDLVLRTSWVEPGYLEPDASWCLPGGEPSPAAANGGDFGAKRTSPVPAAARALADEHARPVLAVWSREDAVRHGAKRPPVAAGVRLATAGEPASGEQAGGEPAGGEPLGVLRVVRTAGVADAVAAAWPGLTVEEADVPGPPTSVTVRAAGWAEAAVLRAAATAVARGEARVDAAAPAGPAGRRGHAEVGPLAGHGRAAATVTVDAAGWPTAVALEVDAGEVLDEVVLRSYLTGAAHMALGWVCTEGIAVGDDGIPEDLTVRSWGVLRARQTPHVDVAVVAGPGPAVRGGDAAFAAVAAACWIAQGLPPAWPTLRPPT